MNPKPIHTPTNRPGAMRRMPTTPLHEIARSPVVTIMPMHDAAEERAWDAYAQSRAKHA
jgi:hypothetical protein